jgi:hypothetical protein
MNNTAVLIGSRAEYTYFDIDENRDWDFIVRPNVVKQLLDSFHGKIIEQYPIDSNHLVVRIKHENNRISIIEIELAYTGSSGAAILDYMEAFGNPVNVYNVAPLNLMYVIRESHRYRDSVHFHKNMEKLETYISKQYKSKIANDLVLQEILSLREKETYTRPHIKLNVGKSDFFSNDGVEYIYDHDSIHEAVSISDKPAYTYIAKGEVLSSGDLFNDAPQSIKDACVMEEAWVIALERGYLPFRVGIKNPRYRKDTVGFDQEYMQELYRKALQKICTTLTSGWFREYASNNYLRLSKVNRDYLEDFLFVENKTNILKPYKN